MIAQALIATSAGITLALGSAHLLYTFHGPLLTPREPGVREKMEQSTIVITRETTLWKVWIGFNASHSLGVMLFGLVYGYLALAGGEFLFHSRFLLALGFCFLAAYVFLAKRYWFSVPFRGVTLAFVCYCAGALAALRMFL